MATPEPLETAAAAYPELPPAVSGDAGVVSWPLARKLETRLGKWTQVITLSSMHLAFIGMDIGVKTFAAK